MDEHQRKGMIIGCVIAALAIGGAGYSIYRKSADYQRVAGVVESIERRCYRIKQNATISNILFAESTRIDCPSRWLRNAKVKSDEKVGYFTFITYRYTSPVDGQSYQRVDRNFETVDRNRLTVGTPIQVSAHTVEPGTAILETAGYK